MNGNFYNKLPINIHPAKSKPESLKSLRDDWMAILDNSFARESIP